MASLTYTLLATIGFPAVFIIFWLEYKFSGCAYGGAYDGTNNWLIRTIQRKITKIRRNRPVRDICDI